MAGSPRTEEPGISASRNPTSSDATSHSASPAGAPDDAAPPHEKADKLGFRARIEANPALKHSYKIGVGVVGFLVLAAGIVMIPFPGPGWLVVIAGLAILASEFSWAERLLDFTKRHVKAWMHWVGAQALWLRVLLGIATALFVYGLLVVMLHLTGVPGWIPQWIPLWR